MGQCQCSRLGSVSLSQFTHHLPRIQLVFSRRERWIFNNHGVILTQIHWLEPPLFLTVCFEPTIAIWSEGLAKGPYQKNARPPVRLEPVIYRLQIQAFYQLTYPGYCYFSIYSLLLCWADIHLFYSGGAGDMPPPPETPKSKGIKPPASRAAAPSPAPITSTPRAKRDSLAPKTNLKKNGITASNTSLSSAARVGTHSLNI